MRQGEQVDREAAGGDGQAAAAGQGAGRRQFGQPLMQGGQDGAPGVVLGEDDAVPGVRRLAGELQRAAGIAVEIHLQVVDQQLAHQARPVPHDRVHRRRVGGVAAGGVDVGAQQVAVAFIVNDAALRPQAVAGGHLRGAGDQGHVQAGAGGLQGVHRPGGAGADYQAVGAGGSHCRPRKSSPRSGRRGAAVMALVDSTSAPAAA